MTTPSDIKAAEQFCNETAEQITEARDNLARWAGGSPVVLCIKCRWHCSGFCSREGSRRISPVTGDSRYTECESQRGSQLDGYCGPSGKWFEGGDL